MRSSHRHLKATRLAVVCAAILFQGVMSVAQSPARRIGAVVDSSRTVIAGHLTAASAANDAGAVPDDLQLQGMTLVFNRTAAQEAALDSLIFAQQNPASAQYHQWLTPDQYAAQFGMAASDLSTVSSWLASKGFSAITPARGGDRISFSGTAAQFASAFGTSIRYFNIHGSKHFAPAGDITLPASIAPAIKGIEHVTDFRAQPFIKKVAPEFTSSQSGGHFMTPKDVATVYDVNAAYNAGYTGTGQSIAVIGQSAVVTSDITNFQSAAGVPVRAPQLVLVPNSGASTIYEGDEAESDLDLEYSSGMGKGTTIYFVYTGSSATADVSTALEYAVSTRIAPIVTISYGYPECDTDFTSGTGGGLDSYLSTFTSSLQEASVQGQTIIASAGDTGALACYGDSTTLGATPYANFPASSQYATALGGTEFPLADVANANTTYWQAANGTDVIGSALSYIPEIPWNDNSTTNGLSAGGGGVSLYFPKPTWQTGVAGIPNTSFRVVPDISLDSSEVDAPYLYCSSDASLGITGSCANGFRNTANTYLTAAGGTSFAAPIFAGLLSVIEQKLNTDGLGLLGPTLYTLASNSATYSSVFHDVTTGSTACTSGAFYPTVSPTTGQTVSGPACTPTDAADFSAGVGYDEATGLGSIDLNNLMNAWPAVTTLAGAQVTITPATSAVVGTNDVLTITVAPASGSGTATGTVAITVDGVAATTLQLNNGSATYTFSTATSGTHIITAAYSGNLTYAAKTGTLDLVVAGIGTFSVAAPALTVSDGTIGSETITITPAGGYTGTVSLSVSTTSSITNTCYALNTVTIAGNTAATTTLQIGTTNSVCSGFVPLLKKTGTTAALRNSAPPTPGRSAPIGLAMAGLLAVGLLGRRSRQLRGVVLAALLAVAGFGLSGCGEGSQGAVSSATNGQATKGTYTVTVVGVDSATPSITSTTTFQLTIQ